MMVLSQSRGTRGFIVLPLALLLVSTISCTQAFVSSSIWRQDAFAQGNIAMAAAKKNQQKSKLAPAEFEFQELKVQLQAMQKAGIPSRDLVPEKRLELENYVRKIVNERPTPVPLKDIASRLPGTKWRLGFSTEGATLGDLPRDATVMLEFFDKEKMDYILQFGKKTLGLNRLVAKSTYTFDSGPVNPGLVTFVYDEIKTDVFGLSNLPVGFFGLLKGRANFVESSYFDGTLWIERGFSPEGRDYFNVYVREES